MGVRSVAKAPPQATPPNRSCCCYWVWSVVRIIVSETLLVKLPAVYIGGCFRSRWGRIYTLREAERYRAKGRPTWAVLGLNPSQLTALDASSPDPGPGPQAPKHLAGSG